jgi:type VI secretion system protein ImpM
MGARRDDGRDENRDDSSDPWPAPAGWFGKIPALGDFISRRLPPEFIETWDQWLSEELQAARNALGADWPESYINAPLWRFALMPGALDERQWFGVLMPSVDRVGRQYPLTIAVSFVPQIGALSRWWSAVLEVAVRAGQPGCSAETLEAGLVAVQDDDGAHAAQDPDPVLSLFAPALAAAGPGTSLWWPWRNQAPDHESVSTLEGLPRAERFLQLLGSPGSRPVARR